MHETISTGVDAVEITRIDAVLQRYGDQFLKRIYTSTERRHCRGRPEKLAARFAGKEAVSKALGTGIRGVLWREIEITSDARGKPLVQLHGAAKARAKAIGAQQFHISLTHSRELAIAFVIAIGKKP